VIRGPRHTVASVSRLTLVVMAAATIAACGGGSSGSSGGSKATTVTFAAADGSTTSLADMKGTPVVLNMWATWCKPCVREMPDFDSVASSVDGVRIIGVNVADSAEDAAAFATKLGVSYEQFNDPTGELSDAFDVTGLPATAFVDASGKVVEVHAGALTAEELRVRIATDFPEISKGTTP
jgi:cytochrome c biogenesis protein CcmG/thiol:disulfide interchange protein DsbE